MMRPEPEVLREAIQEIALPAIEREEQSKREKQSTIVRKFAPVILTRPFEPKSQSYGDDLEAFLVAHRAWENGADNDWDRVNHEYARRKLAVFSHEWAGRVANDEATRRIDALGGRINTIPVEAIYPVLDSFLDSMKGSIEELAQNAYEIYRGVWTKHGNEMSAEFLRGLSKHVIEPNFDRAKSGVSNHLSIFEALQHLVLKGPMNGFDDAINELKEHSRNKVEVCEKPENQLLKLLPPCVGSRR